MRQAISLEGDGSLLEGHFLLVLVDFKGKLFEETVPKEVEVDGYNREDEAPHLVEPTA